jgi:hypothetical protein
MTLVASATAFLQSASISPAEYDWRAHFVVPLAERGNMSRTSFALVGVDLRKCVRPMTLSWSKALACCRPSQA